MFGVFAIDEILRYRWTQFVSSRTLCHPGKSKYKYLIDNTEQLTTLKDTCVVARKSIEVVFTLWNLGKTSKYELNKKGKGKTYVEFSNVSIFLGS